MKSNYGERHYRAKLSDDEVMKMRAMHDSRHKGGRGYASLALLFGVGISTARDICTYRTRRNAGG